MKIDDSFKQPGSVPFKWEIRPGAPKLQTRPTQSLDHRRTEFGSEKQHQRNKKQVPKNQSLVKSPFPETQRKLKPPPAGLYHRPNLGPLTHTRTNSFGSSSRTFSHRFGHPGLAQPDIVPSAGCFPSRFGKIKYVKGIGDPRSKSKPDYFSEVETSSTFRWSVSSRKSVSPVSSSFATSPRPVNDADWASFGLF